MKKIFCVLAALTLVTSAHAITWFNTPYSAFRAYIAPCEINFSSAENEGSKRTRCQSWCELYASNNGWGTGNVNNKVDIDLCSYYPDVDFSYEYCCVNTPAKQIYRFCKCPKDKQLTVFNGNNTTAGAGNNTPVSVTRESAGNTYVLECLDYRCFCENGYYGPVKKLSEMNGAETCTKCPDMPSNNYAYGGGVIGAQTYNNLSSYPSDDSRVPMTTDVTSCNVQMNCPVEPYCDRFDETGQWEFTSNCYYSE